jgi:hypothetical protein
MNPKTMLLIGAGCILLSLFTPVATVSAGFLSRAMNGYETDLVMAGIAGFILLLLGLGVKPVPGTKFSPLAGILGLISLVITGFVFINLTTVSATSGAAVTTGIAVPLCGVGSLLATVAGFTGIPGAESPAASVP